MAPSKKVRPIFFSAHVALAPPGKGKVPYQVESVLASLLSLALLVKKNFGGFQTLRVVGIAKSLDCVCSVDILFKWKCTEDDVEPVSGLVQERAGRKLIGELIHVMNTNMQPWSPHRQDFAPLTIKAIERYEAVDVWDSVPHEALANPTPTTAPTAADSVQLTPEQEAPQPPTTPPPVPCNGPFGLLDRALAEASGEGAVPATPGVLALRDQLHKLGFLTTTTPILPDPHQFKLSGGSLVDYLGELYTTLMMVGLVQPMAYMKPKTPEKPGELNFYQRMLLSSQETEEHFKDKS